MTPQLLPDIERGSTWTRQHRNRCLIRQLLRWKAESNRAALGALEGSSIYPQVRAEVERQWLMGNRGDPGDWR